MTLEIPRNELSVIERALLYSKAGLSRQVSQATNERDEQRYRVELADVERVLHQVSEILINH